MGRRAEPVSEPDEPVSVRLAREKEEAEAKATAVKARRRREAAAAAKQNGGDEDLLSPSISRPDHLHSLLSEREPNDDDDDDGVAGSEGCRCSSASRSSSLRLASLSLPHFSSWRTEHISSKTSFSPQTKEEKQPKESLAFFSPWLGRKSRRAHLPSLARAR